MKRCKHSNACYNSTFDDPMGRRRCDTYCLDYEVETSQVIYQRMDIKQRDELLKTVSGVRMKLESHIDKTVKPSKEKYTIEDVGGGGE